MSNTGTGLDINQSDENGRTALHHAAASGEDEEIIVPTKRQRIEVYADETLTCDSIEKIFRRVGKVESVELIGKGKFSVVMSNNADKCIRVFNGLNLDDKYEESHFRSYLIPL